MRHNFEHRDNIPSLKIAGYLANSSWWGQTYIPGSWSYHFMVHIRRGEIIAMKCASVECVISDEIRESDMCDALKHWCVACCENHENTNNILLEKKSSASKQKDNDIVRKMKEKINIRYIVFLVCLFLSCNYHETCLGFIWIYSFLYHCTIQ